VGGLMELGSYEKMSIKLLAILCVETTFKTFTAIGEAEKIMRPDCFEKVYGKRPKRSEMIDFHNYVESELYSVMLVEESFVKLAKGYELTTLGKLVYGALKELLKKFEKRGLTREKIFLILTTFFHPKSPDLMYGVIKSMGDRPLDKRIREMIATRLDTRVEDIFKELEKVGLVTIESTPRGMVYKWSPNATELHTWLNFLTLGIKNYFGKISSESRKALYKVIRKHKIPSR
jgi:hypothetical protein